MNVEKQEHRLNTAEQRERQFELAKLDYQRLATQEQSLMDRRPEIWTKFFAILLVPTSYVGVVGLKGGIYLMVLIPFFITCISLEIKHDEKVLRYDVRKVMKRLAKEWQFENFDSKFSQQDGSRWWHGYYKLGRAFAFLAAEIIATVLVSWYTSPQLLQSLGLAILNAFFILVTAWCMLF
jgi:hypothetical protein